MKLGRGKKWRRKRRMEKKNSINNSSSSPELSEQKKTNCSINIYIIKAKRFVGEEKERKNEKRAHLYLKVYISGITLDPIAHTASFVVSYSITETLQRCNVCATLKSFRLKASKNNNFTIATTTWKLVIRVQCEANRANRTIRRKINNLSVRVRVGLKTLFFSFVKSFFLSI